MPAFNHVLQILRYDNHSLNKQKQRCYHYQQTGVCLKPVTFDLPDHRWWQNRKKLFLVGFDKKKLKGFSKLCYIPRIVKSIAKIIKDDRLGQLIPNSQLSTVQKNRLLYPAHRQLELIAPFDESAHDARDAVDVIRRIVESARQNFGEQNFADEAVQQLLQLLDDRRFVTKNEGAAWGHSGAFVFAPTKGAVGMLLCGYPTPFKPKEDFKARHFCALQGLKLSSIDLSR